MFEYIVLGIVQGISEWLPVSSEGLLILIKGNFFNETSGGVLIKEALFLHLGTFLAALVYFRKDVLEIIKNIFRYSQISEIDRKLIRFLVLATLISGIIGFLFWTLLAKLNLGIILTSKIINGGVGLLLILTALLQIKALRSGEKQIKDLSTVDSLFLGLMQGLAALPGLSRSGLTVSGLLLRKYSGFYALKLSFLMSLPVILAGNLALNFNLLTSFNFELFLALIFSFLFGLLTISVLLKIAKKINFGYFVLAFALFLIVSVFL